MQDAVETWIVVADGSGARIFEESVRLGALREREDLAVTSHEDRKASSTHRATVTARVGYARHGAGDTDPAAAAEDRFLVELAARIDKAALAGAFRHLVLIAPPKALGALRGALAPATARRIEVCDHHERHGEDAAALRTRLQSLRAAG